MWRCLCLKILLKDDVQVTAKLWALDDRTVVWNGLGPREMRLSVVYSHHSKNHPEIM